MMDGRLDECKFMEEKELSFEEMESMREKLEILKKIASARRETRSSC